MKGRRKRKGRDASQSEARSRRRTPETDDGETDLDNNGRRRKKPKSSKKSKFDEMENFLEQFNAEDSEDLEEEDDGLIEPELVPLRIEDDDDSYIAPLSYTAVKEWQFKMHPRDPETKLPYDWWKADLKYTPIYSKQIKKSEWVTQPAKDIGLGPVLFLHTMKAFAYLFSIFVALNIPLYMFYTKG